ncbi:MAG: hypothetical protein Q9207_006999 [Kuettlingeria erythrocarpa]
MFPVWLPPLLLVASLAVFITTLYPQFPASNVLSQNNGDKLEIARQKIIFDPEFPCQDETAVLQACVDSVVLANNAATAVRHYPGRGTMYYYIGPDSASYEDTISNNYQRVGAFLGPNNLKIHVSCKAQGHLRPGLGYDKAVGASAYSETSPDGVVRHHIILSDVFFRTSALGMLVKEFRDDIRSRRQSPTMMAQRERNAEWVKTQAFIFLHEMMHLDIANGGGVEKHITDESTKQGGRYLKAYGAKLVHTLANSPKERGGGATRASTNAESYAFLASAIWFEQNTGVFPGVPCTGEDFRRYSNPENHPYHGERNGDGGNEIGETIREATPARKARETEEQSNRRVGKRGKTIISTGVKGRREELGEQPRRRQDGEDKVQDCDPATMQDDAHNGRQNPNKEGAGKRPWRGYSRAQNRAHSYETREPKYDANASKKSGVKYRMDNKHHTKPHKQIGTG